MAWMIEKGGMFGAGGGGHNWCLSTNGRLATRLFAPQSHVSTPPGHDDFGTDCKTPTQRADASSCACIAINDGLFGYVPDVVEMVQCADIWCTTVAEDWQSRCRADATIERYGEELPMQKKEAKFNEFRRGKGRE